MQLLQSRALPLGYPAARAEDKQYGSALLSQVKVGERRQNVILIIRCTDQMNQSLEN
jgi:hypothetical protein